MMTKWQPSGLVLVFFLLLVSCKEKPTSDCRGISFKRVYVDKMGSSYAHYLLLTGYSDECFAAVQFSTLAKRYVDTCSYKNPIRFISFLQSEKGIDFESTEPDLAEAKKYELMSFSMDSTAIEKIHIIRNGVEKTFELDNCNWKETF